MSIQEMKEAVSRMPPDELASFSAWFKAYEAEKEGERQHSAPLPEFEPVPYERIAHLLGTGEGPSDLARNKAYLKGLGESSMR